MGRRALALVAAIGALAPLAGCATLIGADFGDEPVPLGDASAQTDGAVDAGEDRGTPVDGPIATDALLLDSGFVAPTCDGVILPGEYGGAGNQAASGSQIWYMTWDETNLYLGITSSNTTEGSLFYLGIAPGGDAGGAALQRGQPYDNTDIVALPFAASLLVYAKITPSADSEARVPDAFGTWGAPDTTTSKICAGVDANVREQVIPWSLVGGRPVGFAWLGYIAAAPAKNPTGYIYGQMPPDNPGGANAGNEVYTRYYAVPNAKPGVGAPFAIEN